MTITLNGTTGITTPAETATTSVTTPLVTSPAATALTIQSAGTTAMTVGTNQNIGIGGAASSDTSYKWLNIVGPSTSGGGIVQLNNSDSSVGINMFCNNLAGYVGTSTSHPLLFRVNSNEAARIDSNGNLLVGTTSNLNSSKTVFAGAATAASGVTSVAEFQGGGSGANGGQIRLLNTYSTATSPSKWLRVDNSGNFNVINNAYTVILSNLDDSGNYQIAGATATKASGTTWANPSDIRLKDNVADYTRGLSELLKVRVCTWTYNGKGGTTAGLQSIGVVADEIATVLPDTVREYQGKLNLDDKTETAIKQFDASEVIWLLVKSTQELSAKNDALEARLAALEAK
jgi:hypothetical protein